MGCLVISHEHNIETPVMKKVIGPQGIDPTNFDKGFPRPWRREYVVFTHKQCFSLFGFLNYIGGTSTGKYGDLVTFLRIVAGNKPDVVPPRHAT